MGTLCKIFGHDFNNEYHKPFNFRCKRCGELNRKYLTSINYPGIPEEKINGSSDLDALKLLSMHGTIPDMNAARNRRMHLISNLADQAALLSIVNGIDEHLPTGKHGEIAAHFDACAAERLTDQSALTEIANNHQYPNVRCAAIRQLTDQSVIERFARREKGDVQREAFCRLENQNTIVDILKKDLANFYVDQRVISALTDQHLIAELIKSANDSRTQLLALEKLTETSLIADIAQTHTEPRIRQNAIKKLTDESVLAIIARKDKELSVRNIAVEKLTDESVLANIVLSDKANYLAALRKIENTDLLFTILRHPDSEPIKNDVISRLGGYYCISCQTENLPQDGVAITCACKSCNAENHDFKTETHEVAYIADDRREITVERCTRCGLERNHGSRESPAARLF